MSTVQFRHTANTTPTNPRQAFRRQIIAAYAAGIAVFSIACGLQLISVRDLILFLLGSGTMMFLAIHASCRTANQNKTKTRPPTSRS